MSARPSAAPPPRGHTAAAAAGDTALGVALLLVVLASALALALGAWLGAGPGAAGVPHARIPAMFAGGASGDRDGAVLAAGAVFGALQIVFFGLCFALGMRRGGALGRLARPLAIGVALYLAVWGALVAAYAQYAAAPMASPRWLGLPLPTALLLFALWPFPLWFAALYLRGFERHVLTDDDFARFRARLEALAARDAQGGRDGEARE
ncbi:MAG: hypothetical protein R3E88_08870 [Myxococcota bacterium]